MAIYKKSTSIRTRRKETDQINRGTKHRIKQKRIAASKFPLRSKVKQTTRKILYLITMNKLSQWYEWYNNKINNNNNNNRERGVYRYQQFINSQNKL
jgi:hypothetical protein